MYVLLGQRGSGKTTALVNWLIEGEQIDDYPGWSRVIVCATSPEVVRVTSLVREATQEEWRRLPFAAESDDRNDRIRALTDCRKAVWSLKEFPMNSRGTGAFEYAVDNLDEVLRILLHASQLPDRVTMTAEVWT